MNAGWNIFPIIAAVVVLLSATGAFLALRSRERSVWAMLFTLCYNGYLHRFVVAYS